MPVMKMAMLKLKIAKTSIAAAQHFMSLSAAALILMGVRQGRARECQNDAFSHGGGLGDGAVVAPHRVRASNSAGLQSMLSGTFSQALVLALDAVRR